MPTTFQLTLASFWHLKKKKKDELENSTVNRLVMYVPIYVCRQSDEGSIVIGDLLIFLRNIAARFFWSEKAKIAMERYFWGRPLFF
jgi:hypothetical protein